MAIIKAKARQDSSVGRVSESGEVYTRATRDGSLFALDWKTAMIMEGRGFTFKMGALTTPIAVAGTGNAVDADKPDWELNVPSGTSIMPIFIEMAAMITTATTDATEVDIVVLADQDTYHVKTSGTATTIYNLNTLHTNKSNCDAAITITTTYSTDPVFDLELAHVCKVFKEHSSVGVYWMENKLLYEPKTPIILNGPASLFGMAGCTKGCSIFTNVQWIELPTSLVRES